MKFAAARPSARTRGFTLLEVMIALAILSVSLVAIAGINSGAMNMHLYAKRLTIGTLLARGKMASIESKLQAEGLPADDDVQNGNFEEDGFADYFWEAQIIRPKTENVNVQNLLAMTGMGLDGKPKNGSGTSGSTGGISDLLGSLGGLLGGAAGSTGTAGGPTAGTSPAALAGMAGSAGGLLGGAMTAQFQQMLDQLGKTVREVRLTVSWKNGKQVEKFTVVSHFVSLGPGTDQVQSDAVGQQAQNALNQATGGATGTVGPNGLPMVPNGIINNNLGIPPPGGLNRLQQFNMGGGRNPFRVNQ